MFRNITNTISLWLYFHHYNLFHCNNWTIFSNYWYTTCIKIWYVYECIIYCYYFVLQVTCFVSNSWYNLCFKIIKLRFLDDCNFKWVALFQSPVIIFVFNHLKYSILVTVMQTTILSQTTNWIFVSNHYKLYETWWL